MDAKKEESTSLQEHESGSIPVLKEGYYLDNFWRMVDAVWGLYDDLFSPEEVAFVEDLRVLPLGAQRLYVRLLSRRGECFRLDRISYTEIPDLDKALASCRAVSLLGGVDELPLSSVLDSLVKTELVSLVREYCLVSSLGQRRKHELIGLLCASEEEQAIRLRVSQMVPMVRLLRWECTLTIRLCMFGSLSYDLTDFVLQDLGVVVYESYEILRVHRLFPDRKSIEEKLMLSRIRDAVDVLLEGEAIEEAMRWAGPVVEEREWSPTSLSTLDRICIRVGRHLERRGRLQEALGWMERAVSPPARERCARMYLALGEPQRALSLSLAMKDAPRSVEEGEVALRLEDKARRALGESVPRRRRPKRPQQDMLLSKGQETVEQSVLQELRKGGKWGCWGENHLWLAIFGLATWDLLFASVPGAFHHPFQRRPMDLYRSTFRTLREPAFSERMDALASGGWGPRLLDVYDQKVGIANAFVWWERVPRDWIERVIEYVPGGHMAAICDRLSRDVKRFRRGFPDLFVCSSRGYCLLEVKGPGDQLRAEQLAWLDYFASNGIPASTVRVSWRSEEEAQLALF
jgi:hypothetical protein